MSAEAELAALEAAVLNAAQIADYRRRVSVLRELVERADDQVRAMVLAMTAPRLEAQALAAVLDAFGAGARDALRILRNSGLGTIARIERPTAATRAIVGGLDREGRIAFARAQRLAQAGASLDTVIAPLVGHANAIGRRVTQAVNAAGNEGSRAVADAADMPVVWVAETNACVRCLAYSGRIAQRGQRFPGGLTYGKPSSADRGPLPHPPLHPHCRCTIEPLNDPSYAETLRREANRSVLRGFSLESESMGVRVDAAERLAREVRANGGTVDGWDVPKSVLATADRAVRNDGFTTRGRP